MSSSATLEIIVGGMHCVNCAARIEKTLNALPQVEAAVNFATEKAYVRYPGDAYSEQQLLAAIETAGFTAQPAATLNHAQIQAHKSQQFRAELQRFALAAVLTLPLIGQMLWMTFTNMHAAEPLPRWLQLALSIPVQFWIGARFYTGAWHALRGGSGNMDVLVVLGTSMAWIYSTWVTVTGQSHLHVYFEASMTVITLVLLGKLLEARAKTKTQSALAELLNLQPAMAHVLRAGQWQDMPVEHLIPGDEFLVRSGEAVPVDGEVREGASALNEAMLTGESIPVEKHVGDTLYAGTINGDGLMRVRATGVGSQTLLAGIVRLVEAAQGSKAPVQHMVDRISAIFVPTVCMLALITFFAWWQGAGQFSAGLINAVAVLVIACPCALGLATPAALVVGCGQGARAGILIRNAQALEEVAQMRVLALDKTGTLTLGHPILTTCVPTAAWTQAQLLTYTASLEQGASHPLASALVAAAQAQGLALILPAATQSTPGKGIQGQVWLHTVHAGTFTWLQTQNIPIPADAPMAAQGTESLVAVAIDGTYAGYLGLADPLRPGAAAAIAALRAADVDVVMLTGDRQAPAAEVAQNLGITRFEAGVLPQGKAEAIARLKSASPKLRVGMAGDGVNDAPALAAADVSFALGAGTGVAMAAADITLMRNELMAVLHAIDLSRATLRKIRQNLFWAFCYNVIGLPLAALGYLSPVFAGAAMALSSVSVVTNALLLKRWRPRAVPFRGD